MENYLPLCAGLIRGKLNHLGIAQDSNSGKKRYVV